MPCLVHVLLDWFVCVSLPCFFPVFVLAVLGTATIALFSDTERKDTKSGSVCGWTHGWVGVGLWAWACERGHVGVGMWVWAWACGCGPVGVGM